MLLGLLVLACSYLVSSHFLPWTSFQQEYLAAVGVVLMGAEALAKPGKWEWPKPAVFAAVLSLVPLLQAASGRTLYAIDGVLAWAYLLGFALSIALGYRLAITRRDELFDGLAGVMLSASVVSVGLAACQWLGVVPPLVAPTPLPPGARPFGNLAQPNHLATLLLLGLVSVAWLRHQGRIRGGVFMSTALFLCVGIALTQSRQAWIGLALLALWTTLARSRAGMTIPVWFIPTFAGLLAGLILAIGPLSEALMVSGGRSLEELTSKGTRTLHWQYMTDAISRAPWFGYGWNELNVAQSLVAPDHPAVREMVDHSHNLLLDLMVWNGVPLGVAIFSVLAWWIWSHLRTCKDSRTAFVLASLLIVGAHAAVEYPLSYAYFLLPVGLMMGAVDALSPIGRAIEMPRFAVMTLTSLVVAVTGAIGWDYIHVDGEHRKMRLEKFIVDPDTNVNRRLEIRFITNWRDFLVVARTEAFAGMPPDLIETMRKVHLRHPHPPILLRYALAAGLNGRPDEAHNSLVVLCQIHSEERCREGHAGWLALQTRFPQLRSVEFPPTGTRP